MHNRAKWVLLFILMLFITACGDNNDVANIERDIVAIEAEVGAITEIECPLQVPGETEGESYSCGVYTVPVDYADPAGETLNLTYVVLHATGDNPLPDPIVYLAGGPGQSGIVAAGGILYGELRQNRDIIFPAQRGTLFSHRLVLEECITFLSDQLENDELESFVEIASNGEKPDRKLPYSEYLDAYSENVGIINGRCHDAFTQAGLDPTQFNTANSSNDLVGLMSALGYDSFNLHGVSYGTRLALEAVRRHPEANIRSVVLDSPAPPTEERLADVALAFHTIVLQLFEDCQADAECNAAYPDLAGRTNALLNQLAEQPITAGEQTIGPDELVAQLADLGNTRANYVPRMIAELEAGDATTYLALYNGEVGTTPPEGSLLSKDVSNLISQISEAGITAEDPFASLQVVAAVLSAAREENPREAMKAAAQEELADSDALPLILERIDNLTPENIQEILSQIGETAPEVDEDEVQKRTEATAKNTAYFMLNGIVCLEQIPFENVENVLVLKNDLAIPALVALDSALATEVGNCTNYPMGEPDPTYHHPLDSDIPILILQGEFDTRTPLQNGIELDQQLANATLVIIPQAGHETWTSATGCIGQISIQFILNPDQAPDLSCLEQRQERFSLPGEPLAPAE